MKLSLEDIDDSDIQNFSVTAGINGIEFFFNNILVFPVYHPLLNFELLISLFPSSAFLEESAFIVL